MNLEIINLITKTKEFKKMKKAYNVLKENPELFSWFIAFFPPTQLDERSEHFGYWQYRDEIWKEEHNSFEQAEVTELYKFGSNLKEYIDNWTPNYKLEEIERGYFIRQFYFTSNFHLSNNRGFFSDEIYLDPKMEEKEAPNQSKNHNLKIMYENKDYYFNIKIVQSFYENKIRQINKCNISYSLVIELYDDYQTDYIKMI